MTASESKARAWEMAAKLLEIGIFRHTTSDEEELKNEHLFTVISRLKRKLPDDL